MAKSKRDNYKRWKPDEYAYLLEMINSFPNEDYGYYADRLEDKFGRQFDPDYVERKLKRSGKGSLSFVDQKNLEEYKPDKLLDIIITAQKELQKRDDKQTKLTTILDDDKPIAIAFTGDWHVGGERTDHEKMLEDFELLRTTEGLYTILMGDYNDNYTPNSHKGGNFEQVITADKQKEITQYLFTKFFNERCISVIKGNHDNWEAKETGEDFVAYLARKIKSPYLWYGGEINLRFGQHVYNIHARHSYKYNSSLNTTNSQRNLFANTHADIIALAHIHNNEVHDKSSGGKDTVWLRSGSYKLTDDFGQWIGGYSADTRIPMVIIYPNTERKKVIPFRNFKDGIKYLQSERA